MSRRHEQVLGEVEHLILHVSMCGHDHFEFLPSSQVPSCSEWHRRSSDFVLLDVSGQVCFVGNLRECEAFLLGYAYFHDLYCPCGSSVH